MSEEAGTPPKGRRSAVQAEGRCVCGGVRFEIDVPAVWAWHDHGARSRHAQGCAYATYVGSWKSRFRILEGEALVSGGQGARRGRGRAVRRKGEQRVYRLMKPALENMLERA